MNGNLSPWLYAQHIRRQEYQLTVGTSQRVLLPVNPNRLGLIVSCPSPSTGYFSGDGSQIQGADTSTTGVKLSKSANSGTYRALITATFMETVGTTVVADLELVRSATTYKLARFTGQGSFSPNMPLQNGDTIQWDVSTAIASSTADFTIQFATLAANQRITLSVNSPVVDGAGLCIYPGNNPIVIWKDVIGDALTEDIYGIASLSNMQIGIWDLFY